MDTLEDRFWAKVQKGPECWEWTGDATTRGYGLVWQGEGVTKRYAHRVAYAREHGSIAEGVEIMHLCDNPKCVRPSHLKAGTHAENMADSAAKGRTARGERHGSATLTEADVRQIRTLSRQGVGGSELARRFSVSPSAICDILKGRNWKWLT